MQPEVPFSTTTVKKFEVIRSRIDGVMKGEIKR